MADELESLTGQKPATEVTVAELLRRQTPFQLASDGLDDLKLGAILQGVAIFFWVAGPSVAIWGTGGSIPLLICGAVFQAIALHGLANGVVRLAVACVRIHAQVSTSSSPDKHL